MDLKALKTLEYNKIIEMLEEHVSSDGAQKMCRELLPMTDIESIRLAQEETSDALTRIFQKGSLSFNGVKDIRTSLKHLEIGGTLSIEELLNICTLLETTNKVKTYSRRERDDIKPDSLDEMFSMLEPIVPLSKEIRRCIISNEEISDDASSGLKQIRRSIRNTNEKIHNQMTSMLNNSTLRTYLQDSIITMRNDRYCIPVKAEYKNQIPGMIHDQSSSGSTVFIEPVAIVKLNNDLKELFIKEQHEIEQILATLSVKAFEYAESISTNYELLVRLDFIFAKASLAKDMNGSKPVFNTDGYINIKNARHPLIDPKKVVPINVHLGKDFNLLIITGPNTGGKTVSLKTVGLLTLMGQAGLHIPASDNSILAVFNNVFADIGDEQSIEQNLSTFSAHMTNTVRILENIDYNSLVLFDELGAGTDPTEGAALAIAILSYLHRRNIRTMATTHYSEIKVFALSTEGVENASCEFDIETLSPTYHLLIGVPGKSNAFAISQKLGLSNIIIEDAKSRIGEQTKNFEELIADLEDSKKTIEKERVEIEYHKNQVKKLQEKLEQKQSNISKRHEDIVREANEQAHAILREAKEYADKTISDINKLKDSNASIKDFEKTRTNIGSKIKNVEKNLAYKQHTNKKKNRISDFKIGDSVKVLSMNLKGTVTTLPNQKGDVYVQMGILRSLVNINDLEIIDEPTITSKALSRTNQGKIKMSKSSSVSTEVNLIGKTTDEAIAVLEKYLDDAYLAHLPSVRVVHGRGTGALRNAVHKYLKRQKYVKSFRLGEFGEGDTGVTIVEFE